MPIKSDVTESSISLNQKPTVLENTWCFSIHLLWQFLFRYIASKGIARDLD